MQRLVYAAVYAAAFVLCLCDAETDNKAQSNLKCSREETASTALDTATDFMKKAKNLLPNCNDKELYCEKKVTSLAFLDVASQLISQAKENVATCPEPVLKATPTDCSEILKSGKRKSGVYTIWPRTRVSPVQPLRVYCDMDTDGGGWTVIQRRGNFSTHRDYFYKDWKSYKNGFGDITEEFWLGLDNIHALTNQAKTTIRVDLEDAAGETGHAHYDTFWIGDETTSYTMHIEGYKGTVGDAMWDTNSVKFSTKDRDNDTWKAGSCAVDRQAAWWYTDCSYSNLNGLNQPGVNSMKGIRWYQWRKNVSLAGVEMKVRHERS